LLCITIGKYKTGNVIGSFLSGTTIPVIVELLEILSYLNLALRLRCVAVWPRWRCAIFAPSIRARPDLLCA